MRDLAKRLRKTKHLRYNRPVSRNVKNDKSDQVKTDFLANISHELRTPLTLILTPLEDLLRKGELPYRASLETMHQNAERLLRLVDDLLDLSQIEASGLRLRVSNVELRTFCERLANRFRPAADAHQIVLSSSIEEGIEPIHADPHRLETVLSNLLSNAIKFTPDNGHVSLMVHSTRTGVRFEVRDDGPGLSEQDKAHIFERFYQGEQGTKMGVQGAGIGLSLASELVRLHGGALDVESTPEQGCAFFFTLPRGKDHYTHEVVERRSISIAPNAGRRSEDRVPSARPVSSKISRNALPSVALPSRGVADDDESRAVYFERGRKARVMIFDDNEALREMMARLLSPQVDVIAGPIGERAYQAIRDAHPDLVLADVMMPEVSGTDICQFVKNDPDLKNTVVILVTAKQGSDSVIEGYKAGADDFLSKPFHPRVLVARVRAQLKLRAFTLQLANQSRLTTAATLAAGVAHEVKNPVNAIMNAASVLKTGHNLESKLPKMLDVIENGAKRISDIVSALDDQVRPADGDERSLCNVREGLESAMRLLEHRMHTINVHNDYKSDVPVVGEPRQLNQVFLNIVDNAVRMQPNNLWLTLRNHEVPHLVEVRIADDGPGVPVDKREHIFDPFFTTRPVGEGTGLGLYLCRKIVRDFGGDIYVQDRKGGGAEFVITLPTREHRSGRPA